MGDMTAEHPTDAELGRLVAILNAVARGRCELVPPAALFIDGLPCCDQYAARHLVNRRLLRGRDLGTRRCPAELTDLGSAVLEAYHGVPTSK